MGKRNIYKENNLINYTLNPRYDFKGRNAGLPDSNKKAIVFVDYKR